MDNNISRIFELNSMPMLAVENFKIRAANSSARKLLGEDIVGRSPVGLLPDHVFAHKTEKFTCSALIGEASFAASVHRSGDTVYISLTPLNPPDSPTDYVSDYLLASLLNELFTLGISIRHIQNCMENCGDEKLLRQLATMNRSYFTLSRSLQNLHTSLLLRKNDLYVNRKNCDLCRICSELASTLSGIRPVAGVELDFSTPLGSLPCSLDHNLIERALLNIVCNSYAAMPSGGKLCMKLEKLGDKAIISVEDCGCGIPADVMNNIFTRYEQPLEPDGLRRGSAGGLGLGVARGIVEKHGGAIIIESREGGGSCVRMILPADPGTILRLDSSGIVFPRGMHSILTELSPILDNSFYSVKYTD